MSKGTSSQGWLGFRVRPDPSGLPVLGSHMGISTASHLLSSSALWEFSESCRRPFLGVLGVAKDVVPFLTVFDTAIIAAH